MRKLLLLALLIPIAAHAQDARTRMAQNAQQVEALQGIADEIKLLDGVVLIPKDKIQELAEWLRHPKVESHFDAYYDLFSCMQANAKPSGECPAVGGALLTLAQDRQAMQRTIDELRQRVAELEAKHSATKQPTTRKQ